MSEKKPVTTAVLLGTSLFTFAAGCMAGYLHGNIEGKSEVLPEVTKRTDSLEEAVGIALKLRTERDGILELWLQVQAVQANYVPAERRCQMMKAVKATILERERPEVVRPVVDGINDAILNFCTR